MLSLFISLIISLILVHGIIKKFDHTTLLLSLILTVLFYLILNGDQGLPKTTTPIAPHLGLDGISLENKL